MHSFSYYLGFYNFKIFWNFFQIFLIFLDFPKFYPRRTTYRFARDVIPCAQTKCASGKKIIPGELQNLPAVSITAGM
jgi:hypothetical protein